ncbi:hypothetical protein N7494_001464 [Penicillium frequentans]|uniref:Uncharacterized protein n=1 Tax=Penicillium frequentans TaxID=3151616 RepID=A0AAD6CUK5_9EURO|nr:hypothetical protein N7494_008417 [Penicillium glabrum]KAJ5552086.1 hypothetical protein N7494_001464 [Penicillium glabrum]
MPTNRDRRLQRARVARHRTKERPDSFQNIFLYHDPRLLASSEQQQEQPAWSIIDDLREALDAPPVPRQEEEDPTPVARGTEEEAQPPSPVAIQELDPIDIGGDLSGSF